jgi:hypothetical protein
MTLETATAPAPVADNAPLTADQHSALLVEKAMPPKRERAKPPAAEPEQVEEITEDTSATDAAEDAGEVEDTQDTEAAPQADEGAEDEPTEANVDGDESDQAEPAPPAIEPPKFWDAEGKESFAKLPAAAQQAVLKYEEQRTKAVAKAMQKSAEVQKVYEAKQQQLLDTATRIEEQYIDPAVSRMKEWDAYFASDEADELAQTNPAEYLRLQNAHRREKRELDEAVAAKTKAERTAFAEFVAEQARLIPELVPELADEKEGPKRKAELFAYLRDTHGFPPERLQGLSAKEAQIAWKAKQFDNVKDFAGLVRDAEAYRKSMKLAEKAPQPKPKPNAGPTVPSTGQGQRLSSSETRFKTLNSKQNLSAAEHSELMQLKAKLRK